MRWTISARGWRRWSRPSWRTRRTWPSSRSAWQTTSGARCTSCPLQYTRYRVTHQVGQNLLWTSKQKFRFGLSRPGLARPKRNFCFEVNIMFWPTWCVTLYVCTGVVKNASSRLRDIVSWLRGQVDATKDLHKFWPSLYQAGLLLGGEVLLTIFWEFQSFTEMRFNLCRTCSAGPRQRQSEQLRKSRKKFHQTKD